MIAWFRKLLTHKHDYKQAEDIYHDGNIVVGRVFRCSCGEERRELTPAGYQLYRLGAKTLRGLLGYED